MAVQEIIKNKKYKIVVPIGYNGNKRIRHIETFNGGRKEAVLRENELKISLKNNTYINNTKKTMQDLLNEWLENYMAVWEPKTYSSNKLLIKNINKCIGHIYLKDLNVKILEGFYKELRTNTKFSDNTIQHYYTAISTALNKAVIWGYILTNPNRRIEKPKFKKKEIECYTPEQVKLLLEALKNECIKYQSIVLLALDSGCRRGEITGLTWEDINFDECNITINKTTQYVKDIGVIEKGTKSETSNRKIYITPTTINVLRKYRKEQLENRLRLGSKWEHSKRVFTTEYGADMHPDTPSKILRYIIKRNNLPKISFHGIRHTCISLQIASGIQAQIISKRAGHSNITVTHNTYSHFFDSGFKEVANKMEEILKA
jgi:integrase